MNLVLVFARGVFDSRHVFATREEAEAYKHGFTRAAGMVSGGSFVRAWCLPEDRDAMMSVENPYEIDRAEKMVHP